MDNPEHLLLGLCGIVLFGTLAQWLAWRLRLPSILLLLTFGLIAGPGLGYLNPNEIFGDLLLPVVSASVAVILFEGSLSLRVAEFRKVGLPLVLLLTVGAAVTWGLTTWAARHRLSRRRSVRSLRLSMRLMLDSLMPTSRASMR